MKPKLPFKDVAGGSIKISLRVNLLASFPTAPAHRLISTAGLSTWYNPYVYLFPFPFPPRLPSSDGRQQLAAPRQETAPETLRNKVQCRAKFIKWAQPYHIPYEKFECAPNL